MRGAIAALTLLFAACGEPTPTPAPAPAPPPAADAPPIAEAPAPPPLPEHALLYPPTPCLGPVPDDPKRPPAPGPAITCDDARAQRDAWVRALPGTPAPFPQALPTASPRLATLSTRSATTTGSELGTRGPAGTLHVDLTAAGAIDRLIHGAVELVPRRGAATIVAVSLPADLAPREIHVYDIVGPTGRVEARLTGPVSLQSDIAYGLPPVPHDAAALAAWMQRELPPVHGPTLTVPDGSRAIFDLPHQQWRVWTASDAEMSRENTGEIVELGGAGIAVAIEPVGEQCLSRWFGPDDPTGQLVCRISAMPGGGARFTRKIDGGLEIVDVDPTGAQQLRLTLPRARPDGVSPVASPRDQIAWEQDRKLIVQDAADHRITARNTPACRADAPPYCAATYARILADKLLVEEQRGPDYAQSHIIGLAGELKAAACQVHDVRHDPATSEALLECNGAWLLRTWTVADGSARDSAPSPERLAAAQPSSDPEIAGQRLCAVDGWFYQGPACTGLQRYNAKRGMMEPIP